jgi:GntR family transcriptional repressor for pyruvate dehydrogenase complex
MLQGVLPYLILQYIVNEELTARIKEPVKLPSMDDLVRDLGISRGKLREELLAAQAYGVVEMRPGDGTYVCPFEFYTAAQTLLLYSIGCDWTNFQHFYELRIRLEVGFWEEAASCLEQSDKARLAQILDQAEHKLGNRPVEIPHREHRDFHLLIYSRLKNRFAQDLMKAYWDAYEAVGLHRYFDLSYYEQMWRSHRRISDAIVTDRYQEGKDVLAAHFTLLDNRLHGTSDESRETDVIPQKGGPPLSGH